MDLEVRLLGRLEELKKALDISELQEKVTSNQSEIATLQEVIDRERREAGVKVPDPVVREGFGAPRGQC